MSEPVGVLLAATGAGLLYAALTDQNPISELRKALTTGDLDGPTPAASRLPFGTSVRTLWGRITGNPDAGGDISAGTGGPPGPGFPTSGPASSNVVTDPSQLVNVGGGRLTPSAARAFTAWQAAYGRPIPITGAWRSPSTQADGYERDPSRFAKPGTSAHEEARAVDVNLPALGINPSGAKPSDWLSDPNYFALVDAASYTGWCNYQVKNNSTGGKIPEPWHFSWGVCK